MNTKTLLAAALAAGSLMGFASVSQATPAVVAGTGYGPSAPAPYYGGTPVYNGVPVYNGTVYAHPGETVVIRSAPPAPVYEAVPTPREGYVWAPGHYEWRNGQYAWIGGEWIAARPGYAWQAAHWEQRTDGSWYLVGGTWVRTDNLAYNGERGRFGDRDHDGVVNRDDHYPRDPSRY